uniref:G protein-coupled receptor n=1 Tax=Meloidogyne hapla TaxID=6305 RepID=A0A1I8AXV0_MELHA
MTQYVYRFCILCRSGVVSTKIFLCLAIGQTCLFFSHGYLLAWADYPREDEKVFMKEIREKIMEESGLTDVEFISFVNARNYRWLIHLVIMLILLPGFYAIVGICFFKIRKAVQGMNVLKLKEYSNQVSAALAFQALLPTFEVIGWGIQVFAPVFITEHSTVMYTVFTDIPIPALNPIGTILLVAPYR